MSSASFTTLTTSSNCILGSASTNAHQLNGSLTIYNNGLTLNNSNISQTGSSQNNTIAGSTTFNNSVTLNNGITNNNITIVQLSISYGYRAGVPTSNYLQFDLPNTQTWFLWDNFECAYNLLVNGTTTINGLTNNSTSNFYNAMNLLNSTKANLNAINFNNGTNSYSISQIDNGSNYLKIGRTGYNDLIINSDGSLTIGGNVSFTSSINTPSITSSSTFYCGSPNNFDTNALTSY